ncbi:MAG: ABC transporter ATP-binding protein [Pseudomonadota bacterium]
MDDKTHKERAKLFGYLPQSINLSPAYVKDFLMMGRFPYTSIFSGYGSFDREVVKNVAEEFGLTPYMTRDITTLSQGELQRVILAKVFIQQPKVLLLDEPTTALDMGFKEHIKHAIYKYLELNKDCIAVISTHDPDIFAERANKTVMLKDGNIFNGDIRTLFGLTHVTYQ